MSRSSVSPFFSQKFRPIITPTSAALSSQAVPTCAGQDGSASRYLTGFHAHAHGNNDVQDPQCHSAPQQSKSPQPHTSCSPLSSPYSENDSPQQHASSINKSNQSHLSETSSSDSNGCQAETTAVQLKPPRSQTLPLSVIEEDSYEEKRQSKADYAMLVSILIVTMTAGVCCPFSHSVAVSRDYHRTGFNGIIIVENSSPDHNVLYMY